MENFLEVLFFLNHGIIEVNAMTLITGMESISSSRRMGDAVVK
ncbi:MAG: hypothetical protein V4487_02785 [Chlamydiota bacterium]